MARTANTNKITKVSVSARIPEKLAEAIDGYIWDPKVKMRMPDFVAAAVTAYATELGLLSEDAPETEEVSPKS